MIDFAHGWRAIPGMFSPGDGYTLQTAVKRIPPGQAVVELGAWCGRSLTAICEVLPDGVTALSYDSYLEDSQTNVPESPITPTCAMKIRNLVEDHFRGHGKDVIVVVKDSVEAGRDYTGPPVSVLFIDDHHSAEQLIRDFEVWLPHLAPQATILMHDYSTPVYQLDVTAEDILPKAGFEYIGTRADSIVGVWSRGYR